MCHQDRFIGNHSNFMSLYKKISRCHSKTKETLKHMPGCREIKKEEPKRQIAHYDFLMLEMQDMAIDFHEETY